MRKNQVNTLYFGLIIATFYTCRNTEALCNRHYGPSGSKHCIKLPQFNDYQWSTCRSDAYIKKTTNDRHHCSYTYSTYCYYQCMLEVYGANGGDVYGSCRCSIENPTSSSKNPTSSSKSSNTGVIIGSAAVAVILVVGAIFIVGCLLSQRIKRQRREIGAIQNVAYQGESMPGVSPYQSRPPPAYSERALPQELYYSQSDYGQPAKYPDSSTTIDVNYQNVNGEYSNQLHSNENVQRDIAPHNLNGNPANESTYEEVH